MVVFIQISYMARLKDGNHILAPTSVVKTLLVHEVPISLNHNAFLYLKKKILAPKGKL